MRITHAAILMIAALGFVGAASAQKPLDLGKSEYERKCATCHGVGGKGDGPVKAWLTKAPTDLTTLSRRNGGVFPTQRVWETVDGRLSPEIGPHGSREMPVWGEAFLVEAQRAAGPEGWPSVQPEWVIRGRILALVEYLARIQVQ